MRFGNVRTAFALTAAAACSAPAAAPIAPSVAKECSTVLPAPSARAFGVEAPRRVAEPSLLVVEVRAPLEPALRALEHQVPTKLAEGRLELGPLGAVTYRVERGPLGVRVADNVLFVSAPVSVEVPECRGSRCRVACDALASVELPLLLQPSYQLQPSRVSASFPRGCKVRLLGGFFTVDVTRNVQSELEPELTRAGQRIDRQMPPLRPEVEKHWRELQGQRELPLGCLSIQPRTLMQGPVIASDQSLVARFALTAMPELQSPCDKAQPADVPLPPLLLDPALPEEGSLRLGMVTPLVKLAAALESANSRLAPRQAKVTARGSDVDVELALHGEVCGDVAFSAQPDFAGADAQVKLRAAAFVPGDAQRLEAANIDARSTLAALSGSVQLAPLLSVEGFRQAVPTLVRAQSTPGAELTARLSTTRPAGAAARGDSLVAWLEARGTLRLDMK